MSLSVAIQMDPIEPVDIDADSSFALALEAAGAFAIVLEGVPAQVAARITDRLQIPTIGIGAGGGCDGQILVFHDVVGLSLGATPKFARKYADLAGNIRKALGEFAEDIRAQNFPSTAETYVCKELPEDWDASVEAQSLPPGIRLRN